MHACQPLHSAYQLTHHVRMPTYPRPQRHIERARNMRKSMTSAETYVWTLVRGKRLGWKFRRQEPIGPYIVDFVCIGRRLVVELDGDGMAASTTIDVTSIWVALGSGCCDSITTTYPIQIG